MLIFFPLVSLALLSLVHILSNFLIEIYTFGVKVALTLLGHNLINNLIENLFYYGPYAALCFIIWWCWARHKSADQIKIFSWFGPLLLYPLFFIMTTPVDDYNSTKELEHNLALTALFGSGVVACAYFYVIVLHILTYIFKKIGWVID